MAVTFRISRAYRPVAQSHFAYLIWTFAVTAFLISVPLWVLGLKEVLITVLVIAMSSTVGVCLTWHLSTSALRQNPFMLLAVGSSLGIASVAFLNSLVPFFNVRWLIAGFTVSILTATISKKPVIAVPSKAQTLALATVSWTGIAAVFPVLFAMRPSLSEAFDTYLDLPHHEAISNSIGLVGVSDTSFFPGKEMRYHWLVNSWANFISMTTDALPLETLGLTLPVVAIFLCIVGTFGISYSVGPKLEMASFAGIVVALSSIPVANIQSAYPFILAEVSPSHTFAAPIAIALLGLVLSRWPLSKTTWPEGLLIMLMAFSLPVARAPVAIVLVFGLSFVSLLTSWNMKSVKPTMMVFLLVLLPSLTALSIFVAGGRTNTFELVFNSRLASAQGLFPYTGVGDTLFANVAFIGRTFWPLLMVLPLLFIVPNLKLKSWLGVICGFGLASVFAGLFSDQAGLGQLTFSWASYLLSLPLAAVVVFMVLQSKSRSWRLKYIALGTILGVTGSSFVSLTSSFQFSGVFRWSLGIIPLVILILAAAFSLSVGRKSKARSANFVSAIAVTVLFTALASGIAGSIWDTRSLGTTFAKMRFDPDQIEAGKWVRENTPIDALFVTNRQCLTGEVGEGTCASTEQVTSALTGRRVLVEAVTYSDWPLTVEGRSRIEASQSLEQEELAKYKVTWLWVDDRYEKHNGIPEGALIRQSFGHISIYEMLIK